MRKRVLILISILAALLTSITGKSNPPLPKPVAKPIVEFKHKPHRAKGKGMPHFFQVKK